MIPAFGSLYGLANPALLLAIPIGTALLVYAYLRRGQGQRVTVATLLFLRQLKTRSFARRKFAPPPRFFFELLLLLLLAIGGAGLFREGENQKITMLIDNSLSMAAREDSSSGQSSRLAHAKEQALSTIAGWTGSNSVKVYVTSPTVRSLSDTFENLSKAAGQISSINLTYASDNLEAALGKLLLDSEADRIIVFSDKLLPPDKPGVLNPARARVSFHNVGGVEKKLENIAVTGVNFYRETLPKTSLKIKATISAFTTKESRITVRLEGLTADQQHLSLIENRTLSLPAAGVESLTFENIPELAAYKVSLDNLTADAISEDNSAWVGFSSPGNRIAVISSYSAQQLGLDKIQGTSFSVLSPAQFEKSLSAGTELPDSSDRPSSLIFHRYCPAELPDQNSLFVMPPAGNKLFPVGAEVSSPQITRWLPSHPLNSYLNYPVLSLKVLTPFLPHAWAAELVNSTSGAAALAGERAGHRFAALGFEIFPFEGKNSPLLSVLTLNTIKWLSNFASTSVYQPVWSTLRIQTGESAADIFDPQSVNEKADSSLTAPRSLLLTKPGLIRITSRTGQQGVVAVDFFNEEESDTLHYAEISLPVINTGIVGAAEKQSLAGMLALLVLALMLADLFLIVKRGLIGIRKQ